jgi:hypothetical protein
MEKKRQKSYTKNDRKNYQKLDMEENDLPNQYKNIKMGIYQANINILEKAKAIMIYGLEKII